MLSVVDQLPWLRAQARSRLRMNSVVSADDLIQIGAEAMLKALPRAESPSFLRQAAMWAMVSAMRGEVTSPVYATEDDWLDTEEWWFDADLSAHPEIIAAVAELSPRDRDYVFERFWLGKRKKELCEIFGNEGRWYRPNAIRATLRQKLAHLEDAV